MNEATTLMTFWDTSKDGKIAIDNFNFKLFLEGNNFIKSKPNPQSTFNLIRKNGIFLNIVDEYDIKDFVMDFILEHNFERTVFNLVTSKTSLFKRDYLSMLQTEEINILRDNAETCYLFYKNGVLEVTKKDVVLKDYKEYNLNVWKDQIIDREYSECDHHKSEYRTFIWLISGGFKLQENASAKEIENYKQAVARYNTFQSVIGYLLHSYNNGCDNRAIILNDEMISDEPNGRSGKGVFWNALKHLKKVHSLNGKKFDSNDKFKYSSVKTDTQILVYDDVRKNFVFEDLFSEITEGIDITYKGVDTIKLPISESPKILITTNYTLKGSGGSHDARKFEVELSTFFNSKYTPLHYFGHKLFDNWNAEEWARFDSYMIQCIKKYLQNGLMDYDKISLPIKKLQTEINIELYNQLQGLKFNDWYNYEKLFNDYNSNVGKYGVKTKTAYTQAFNKYVKFFELEVDNSEPNGIKHIMFMKREKEVVKVKDDFEVWNELNEKAK
jgi:hypothetical protein